jgi:recombinational DNA repair ATPase RecF
MAQSEGIVSIEIKFIKGIQEKTLKFNGGNGVDCLLPNKPNILVANNGFGKTSIATAFSAIKSSQKIKLNDKDYYMEQEKHQPSIFLEYRDELGAIKQYGADQTQNEIKKEFTISVINSRLEPKAKKQNRGGFTAASAHLSIQPIDCGPIPEKVTFENFWKSLSESDLKQSVGSLKKTDIERLLKSIDENLLGKKLSKKALTTLEDHIKTTVGELNLQERVTTLKNIINNHTEQLKQYRKYLGYTDQKKLYEQTIKVFLGENKPGKVVAKEDRKNKKLRIEFQSANSISNGERDSLIAAIEILKAVKTMTKEKNILIVDEIFDYLDDANFLTIQYFLSQYLIKEFKKDKSKKVYIIILTHLNPFNFHHYTFKDYKVFYLEYFQDRPVDKSLEELILNRENKAYEEPISKYFLHYHTDSQEITLNNKKIKSSEIKKYADEELSKFIKNQNETFDPLAVCLALRIIIEEIAYNKLRDNDKKAFLEEHGTIPKLEFVEEKAENQLSETYFILAGIYNDGLHTQKKQDIYSPLFMKLSHPQIKLMIKEVYGARIQTKNGKQDCS